MNYTKTKEIPAQATPDLFGAWYVDRADVQGLMNYKIIETVTFDVNSGMDEVTCNFMDENRVDIFLNSRKQNRFRAIKTSYILADNFLFIEKTDEDDAQLWEMKYHNDTIVLIQNWVTAKDLYNFNTIFDGFKDYQYYNLRLTLNRVSK